MSNYEHTWNKWKKNRKSQKIKYTNKDQIEILEIKIQQQKINHVYNIRMKITEKMIREVEYRTIDSTQPKQQERKITEQK